MQEEVNESREKVSSLQTKLTTVQKGMQELVHEKVLVLIDLYREGKFVVSIAASRGGKATLNPAA